MTTATQHLLDTFDLLSAAEKQVVIGALLRRIQDFDFPPLADEELVANAALPLPSAAEAQRWATAERLILEKPTR